MKTIYIVTVDKKISGLGYATLEEAQEFIKNRAGEDAVKNQPPYYNVFSIKDMTWYTIHDVRVA